MTTTTNTGCRQMQQRPRLENNTATVARTLLVSIKLCLSSCGRTGALVTQGRPLTQSIMAILAKGAGRSGYEVEMAVRVCTWRLGQLSRTRARTDSLIT